MARSLTTDCLVIGSGIAGLTCALELAEQGVEAIVISCAPNLVDSNTNWAQGGIIFEGASLDPKTLADDIYRAGCFLNYPPAVQQLCELGPPLVRELLLEKMGISFDRNDEAYDLALEGGHSEARILHRGDQSGRTIQEAIVNHVEKMPALRFYAKTTAVNLLMTSFHNRDQTCLHEPSRCFGAFVFDQESGEVYPIFAQHTVLATGGVGQIYLHSTNFKSSRGDGVALAHRAGCRLENLEYVQFHPTTFYKQGSPRFLVTEALRGEGAVLINSTGERFLGRYLPDWEFPELAPRDKVAKGIHQEMLSQGAPCVFLDLSHRPASWIQSRFPFVYKTCLKHGVDITQEPIPVVPGAHYHCGGVWTDLEGRTTVPHLWAVGETSCTGLHGANRLASTSLLEGLVWGHRAGAAVAEALKQKKRVAAPEIEPWRYEQVRPDASFLSQDWLMLKHTMWNYVGLIKTESRLERAEGILTELSRGIEMFYRKAVLSDALIGLRHAVLVASLILRACKKNRRSLGCYQREDLEI